jgi:hypothetical protein
MLFPTYLYIQIFKNSSLILFDHWLYKTMKNEWENSPKMNGVFCFLKVKFNSTLLRLHKDAMLIGITKNTNYALHYTMQLCFTLYSWTGLH